MSKPRNALASAGKVRTALYTTRNVPEAGTRSHAVFQSYVLALVERETHNGFEGRNIELLWVSLN